MSRQQICHMSNYKLPTCQLSCAALLVKARWCNKIGERSYQAKASYRLCLGQVLRGRYHRLSSLQRTPKVSLGNLYFQTDISLVPEHFLLGKGSKKTSHCQNCQKLSKIIKNCQKLSKHIKKLSKLSKTVKIVKKLSKL